MTDGMTTLGAILEIRIHLANSFENKEILLNQSLKGDLNEVAALSPHCGQKRVSGPALGILIPVY
jgi:hypothetical protein